MSNRKIHLLLSYPADEVGNHLMDLDRMDELKINPHTDVLTEEDYRRMFGQKVAHPLLALIMLASTEKYAMTMLIFIFLMTRE